MPYDDTLEEAKLAILKLDIEGGNIKGLKFTKEYVEIGKELITIEIKFYTKKNNKHYRRMFDKPVKKPVPGRTFTINTGDITSSFNIPPQISLSNGQSL